MFNTLKDKLINATKSVTLFTSTDDNNNKCQIKNSTGDIGGIILQNFETGWMEIHKANEGNAKTAEKVANDIEILKCKIDKHRDTAGQIINIFTNSNLITNINQCNNSLTDILGLCGNVENLLYELENVIEEEEFENMKRQHLIHLENYKIKKNESLNNLKEQLTKQHEQKIKEHEANKQIILEERQKVFQEAFKNDLETYKNFGTIPKIEFVGNKKNMATLEEIQLDLDSNALENFFNNNNNQNSAGSSKEN